MAPRDYKQRPARTPVKKASRPVSAWVIFVAGAMVGILGTVAFFVYEPNVSVPNLGLSDSAMGTKTAATTPRFEFYTVLPEKEIAVPETALAEKAQVKQSSQSQDTANKVTAAERYMLQVGSFRNLMDADRLKAQLALLGLEATIQSVSIDGAETWHRVRVGPYGQMAKLKAARDRLKQNRLKSIVLKLRK